MVLDSPGLRCILVLVEGNEPRTTNHEPRTTNTRETIMTRKDFVAIAGAMKKLRDETADTGSVDKASKILADVCAAHNDLFDEERFLQACGV